MNGAQGVLDFGTDAASSTHVVLPNMTLACRADLVEALSFGDHLTFGRPGRWSAVTCDWCRALGPAYVTAITRRMQACQADVA
ncbi:hypothetical protein [Aeromicrobium sp. IC_218]|uniref:hypothetical protein n=1 Tax=Aeromicrobium sp. IC_218 TaxID=2545468 RepID=UPI00103F5F74|nr:hypothetical protein [Aeromicrobium sp. IC_218]TCI96356.1 hypothetical protein E0W78_14570 [Aeromicrobium sp. IC_218]